MKAAAWGLAVALAAAPAYADPEPDPVFADGSGSATAGSGSGSAAPDRKLVDERTARDSAGAPVSGDESGRLDPIPQDGNLRLLGRALLFPPKLLFEAVWLPFDGILLGFDKYHIERIYFRVFYNANRTIGLVPTLTFESGFGTSIGARFVASNAFGEHERFGLQATTGTLTGDTYREAALAEFHTGQRLGKHLELGLIGNFDRRSIDPFYGIGNGDLQTTPPPAPVDPRMDSFAYETHHHYQEARVSAEVQVHATDQVRFTLLGALTDLQFEPSEEGTPIGDVYNTADIPGFDDGVKHAYGEVEVRLDTRHRENEWEPLYLYSGGSLLAGYAGRVHRLDEGADFWRYGVELQHFFRLARGPRRLVTRFRGAGVSGSRDAVPFTELPELGGGDFLRGYSYERFRDRVAMFGSVQYEWDLSHFVDAYVFTDVGRVYESLDDLSLDHMRVGYGIGLEIHGDQAFLLSTSLASSIDGGLLFSLSFNPVVDARPRWR